MLDERAQRALAPLPGQLSQERVPLAEAAEAFARQDAEGRIPIIVIPQRAVQYLNGMVLAAGVAAVAALLLIALADVGFLGPLGLVAAAVLLVLGILQWFYVRVPEGVAALLARAGRHERTVGSGLHLLPPYLSVTHLVTRREIPFNVPIFEARTADDVRARVDALVTFRIDDPARFVFQISTTDYDQVLQAASQEVMRSLIRSITADRLSDLVGQDAEGHRPQFEALMAPYGVLIHRIIITQAAPPEDFLRSQEGRQLAIIQRAEQAEQQALAQRRQEDAEELIRQRIIAHAEQERESLEAQLRQIAARRHLIEQEAGVEAERLSRLEDRLRRYPLAAHWERERAQLEVARALAGNTRAIMQIGSAGDIVHILAAHNVLSETRDPRSEAAGDTSRMADLGKEEEPTGGGASA